MKQNLSDFQPRFIQILSDEDRSKYNSLRSSIVSNQSHNRFGQKMEMFSSSLEMIKEFCLRNDADDWKRCLVCGVCWIPNGIAVNNTQFSQLLDQCKSSINTFFKKMGYSLIEDRSKSRKIVSDAIPLLKNNQLELREWSLRIFSAETPQPDLPLFNVPSFLPFSTPITHNFRSFSPPQSPIEPALIAGIPRSISRSNDEFFNDPFCLAPDFLVEEKEGEGNSNNMNGFI